MFVAVFVVMMMVMMVVDNNHLTTILNTHHFCENMTKNAMRNEIKHEKTENTKQKNHTSQFWNKHKFTSDVSSGHWEPKSLCEVGM